MAKVVQRKTGRERRHRRVRKHVSGTGERPRLCVFRSLRYVYAQLIDDDEGRTLAAADSHEAEVVSNGDSRRTVEAAKAVGRVLAERAKAAGVERAVFDRGGYRYHGRVKAVAEGAREAGLEF